MSKPPHEYDDDELRDLLRTIGPSDLRYSAAKFEWDQRQERKKARRWIWTTSIAALTSLVLIASLAVQYCASRVTSAHSALPLISPSPSGTAPQQLSASSVPPT